MISEASVQAALDFLRDSAPDIGKAKADMLRADKMLKHIHAMAMKHSGESAVGAQEREAYISPIYKDAIDEAAHTAGLYETLKAKREASEMLIEAWRSYSANYRAMKL